jgi:hypothetical protein
VVARRRPGQRLRGAQRFRHRRASASWSRR